MQAEHLLLARRPTVRPVAMTRLNSFTPDLADLFLVEQPRPQLHRLDPSKLPAVDSGISTPLSGLGPPSHLRLEYAVLSYAHELGRMVHCTPESAAPIGRVATRQPGAAQESSCTAERKQFQRGRQRPVLLPMCSSFVVCPESPLGSPVRVLRHACARSPSNAVVGASSHG